MYVIKVNIFCHTEFYRFCHRYILTVSDYCSKFAWATALPSKEAIPVVSVLHEVGLIIDNIIIHVLRNRDEKQYNYTVLY